jgi:Thioredoxin
LAEQQVWQLHRSTRGLAFVVLYYAAWCPFSRALLTVFDCAPRFFSPEVVFLAVEEAQLPGRLRFSVYAFPTIRLYRGSSNVKYEGNHTLQGILDFVAARSVSSQLRS